MVFPAALQPGLGRGVPGKDLTPKVDWQEAEHFQPPALAILAQGVFAVPSLQRVGRLAVFAQPGGSGAAWVSFPGSSVPGGWACGDGPCCWSPAHCHF